MSRPHDMGGRYGDGPVIPEAEGKVFHADWHARALAVTLAAGAHGKWNIDVSRHARECLAPMDYARFSYYEKWIAALADLLVAIDLVSARELSRGDADATPRARATLQARDVSAVLAKGGPADRPSDIAATFKTGDAVRTRRIAANTLVDGGHTRLPRYAAGAVGRVVRFHGTHVLPDRSAHGLGEGAEPLYGVAFAASELWAHPEHPRDEVVLDLWQSYLAPA
ncbi:Low-molecular weight cobalt-containing nitrile hydratase subunit beta [Roseobacter fucihabitans]|uniref:Nitrile hydratase subunit beta n=1 Tax=Roseobacter fucihabitans TaxID=1537242 RepID=A0ABZ2BP21_9RHOB|nr:nitrile hydratase subunit beta [Roseobacter litoralis]MBC6966012.1 Low-molecular weight cobalt-containing nitrile hydratase subunit beta [Roseobacter litoralis]